jgi:hypothetical protein
MVKVSTLQTPLGPMKFVEDDSMPKDALVMFAPGQAVFRTHHEGPRTGETEVDWIRKPSYVLLTNVGKLILLLAVFGCSPPPLKPLPPVGCKDVVAQCVCDEHGACHWEWVCVPR